MRPLTLGSMTLLGLIAAGVASAAAPQTEPRRLRI